jgi:2-C-methyl-D-erythritol 4-phosphate cytidylyltransferase
MQDAEHGPPSPGCIAAIIPAAGSGERFGGKRNKLLTELAGKPLWFHAASRLAARSEVGRIVMAISDADRDSFSSRFASLIQQLSVELVTGGDQRTDSVKAGLDAIAGDESVRFIAIHDAARPLVSDADLGAVFAAASQSGAAILAIPISGTIKRDLGQGQRSETVDRRELWLALTPQVFRVGLLSEAYRKHNGRSATDDAQLVERIGHDVSLVRGRVDNLKITYPEDLHVAEAILARQANHA